MTKLYCDQGRPSPSEAMMHFPLFQISLLFPKQFSDSAENFPQFDLFPKKIPIYVRQNF